MTELRNTWVNSLPEQVLENTQDIQELQQDATDEAINRENADNALQNQITAEVSAREAADQNLQEQINNSTIPTTLSDIANKIQTNQNHTYIFSRDNAEPGSPMNASGLLTSNDSAVYADNYAVLQAVKPSTSSSVNYTRLSLQYDSAGNPHANINVVENNSTTKTVDLLASGGGIQSTVVYGANNLFNELNNIIQNNQQTPLAIKWETRSEKTCNEVIGSLGTGGTISLQQIESQFIIGNSEILFLNIGSVGISEIYLTGNYQTNNFSLKIGSGLNTVGYISNSFSLSTQYSNGYFNYFDGEFDTIDDVFTIYYI